MNHIVKRKGHNEKFDERKVYASCYAACLSAHIHHREAEKICEAVAKDLKKWVKEKQKVTSQQIFKQTATVIQKYHRNAAYMYTTHREID